MLPNIAVMKSGNIFLEWHWKEKILTSEAILDGHEIYKVIMGIFSIRQSKMKYV